MDRYDRRSIVVRLRQEQARLHPVPVAAERVEIALQVGVQRGTPAVAVRLGQLRDLGQRGGAGLEVAPGADLLTQLVGASQQRLGRGRVVPQLWVRGAGVQLRELGLLGGQVKAAPPCRPPGARA
jgi:hypothetical protein